MNAPVLSILTPAIPKRMLQIAELCEEIERQCAGEIPVEHLVLLDNRRRTIGQKRDALLRAARGDYVTFVDDDDWIEPDYVSSILEAAIGKPDVITFCQQATVNGQISKIEFRLGHDNEPFQPGKTIRRNAWHVCAWRRTLAILSSFPPSNYGEDWAFAARLCALPDLRETHIPKVLHHYRYNDATTAAPMPG